MPTKAEKQAAHRRREKEIKKRKKMKEHEKRLAAQRLEKARKKKQKNKDRARQEAEERAEKARLKKERIKLIKQEHAQNQAAKAKKRKENKRLHEEARLESLRKKKERKRQHNINMALHAERRKEKQEQKALRAPEVEQRSKEAQAEAILRHQREVELTFDISSMEEQIREMLSKHGEIESLKKNIKGGLAVRFATREGAESLLKKKKNTTINASLMFPVTPVVIKQHCLYFMPKDYVIDQEVLNATAEYFSSISVVQQVKKMRNAVLIVFEDEDTRNQMVEQSTKNNWKILDHRIGACIAGLPPALNKKRRKPQHPQKKKKRNTNTNGIKH